MKKSFFLLLTVIIFASASSIFSIEDKCAVILDSSMSARGYYGTKQEKSFTELQRVLTYPLAEWMEENAYNLDVKLLDTELLDSNKELRDIVNFDSKKLINEIFKGVDTNLSKAFNEELIDKYKYIILVTDSIQSMGDEATGTYGYLINTIKDRILNSSINLWMLVAKTTFSGYIYPEVRDATGQKKKFNYQGKRPIIIYIYSKYDDVDNFVSQLVSSIQDRWKIYKSISENEEPLKAIKIFPLKPKTYNLKVSPLSKRNSNMFIKINEKIQPTNENEIIFSIFNRAKIRDIDLTMEFNITDSSLIKKYYKNSIKTADAVLWKRSFDNYIKTENIKKGNKFKMKAYLSAREFEKIFKEKNKTKKIRDPRVYKDVSPIKMYINYGLNENILQNWSTMEDYKRDNGDKIYYLEPFLQKLFNSVNQDYLIEYKVNVKY